MDKPLRIRTSDRELFRRCRRKWELTSHLRQAWRPKEQTPYQWLGSGGHYALEDWHGYNYYESPVNAFNAYVEAQKRWAKRGGPQLPDDWDQQAIVGEGVLKYYIEWSEARQPLNTLWVNGEPQCEVKITLDMWKVRPNWYTDYPESGSYITLEDPWENTDDRELDPSPQPLVYTATLDRVVEEDGELWVEDYKFNKQFYNIPLEWNQQLSAYIFLANAVYSRSVAGGILTQFRKEVARPPRILQSGKLSTAKGQSTTHTLYRQALIDMYGSVDRAPISNVDYLNYLVGSRGPESDKFIRRDRTHRSHIQQLAEADKILLEVVDMTNPNLPLYPSPTKDCHWDCHMRDTCLMIDREDDWMGYLEANYDSPQTQSGMQDDEWRKYLPT